MQTVDVDVKVNGAWVRLNRVRKATSEWWLPQIPSGFAKGQKHRFELRFSSDEKRAVNLTVGQLLSQVSLATGNPSPVAEATGDLDLLGYGGEGTPTPTPSSTGSGTPIAQPSATPTTGSSAPVTPSDTATTAGGTLAHTGADDRTRTIGLASGALVLAGGLLTVVGLRRRKAAGSHR